MEFKGPFKNDLLTGQEEVFSGGTSAAIRRAAEAGAAESIWHIPRGILIQSGRIPEDKNFGIIGYPTEEIREARRKMGFLECSVIADGLGIPVASNEKFGFFLSEINPETGETQEDPKLVKGVWNDNEGRFEGAPEDLTHVLVAYAEGHNELNLHLREEGRQPEGNIGGDPERG